MFSLLRRLVEATERQAAYSEEIRNHYAESRQRREREQAIEREYLENQKAMADYQRRIAEQNDALLASYRKHIAECEQWHKQAAGIVDIPESVN